MFMFGFGSLMMEFFGGVGRDSWVDRFKRVGDG